MTRWLTTCFLPCSDLASLRMESCQIRLCGAIGGLQAHLPLDLSIGAIPTLRRFQCIHQRSRICKCGKHIANLHMNIRLLSSFNRKFVLGAPIPGEMPVGAGNTGRDLPLIRQWEEYVFRFVNCRNILVRVLPKLRDLGQRPFNYCLDSWHSDA